VGTAGHIPIRRCVVCGRRAPKSALVRIVVEQGRVVVDEAQRLEGRGAYICPRPECIRRLSPRRHARALRRPLAKGAWEGVEQRLMAVVAANKT